MEIFFIYSVDLFILSDLVIGRRMQKPNQEIIMLKWILKKSVDLFKLFSCIFHELSCLTYFSPELNLTRESFKVTLDDGSACYWVPTIR
jgi:hypothetical protein